MAAQQATVPLPYVVAPTYRFDGDDGSWSTFSVTAGTPPQSFRVLPATIGEEIWLPVYQGCEGPLLGVSNCGDLRGVDDASNRGYLYNESDTWNQLAGDPYVLSTEQNLFGAITGWYGTDTVSVGTKSDAYAAPKLDKQTIAGIAQTDFWLGSLGLGTSPGKFGNGASIPSLLASMRAQNLTTSLSYGYTAGQSYASPQVPGSLVLGGYDATRLAATPVPVSVQIGTDTSSQTLQLGVQSITASNVMGGSSQQLLSAPINATVDSAVSQLWLPADACDYFASAFGLTYNEEANYYLLNSTTHSQLQSNSPSITLAIGSTSGGATTNIVLPYSAFDLNLSLPIVNSTTPYPYFPLRKAANESQYTLGRVVLQEAYIIVDWERSNLTVGQAVAQNSTTNVVPLLSPSQANSTDSPASAAATHKPSNGMGTGAIPGIVVAMVALLAIAAGLALFFWRRRRRAALAKAHGNVEATAPEVNTRGTMEYFPPEKPGNEKSGSPFIQVSEVDGGGRPTLHRRNTSELDDTQVHEMEDVIRDRELMSTPVFELPGHNVASELDVRTSGEEDERASGSSEG